MSLHTRKKVLQWLSLKRVLAGNIVVFLLVAWGFSGEYLRNAKARDRSEELAVRVSAMEEENEELTRKKSLASSPVILEREARLKLNLRRPGEEVVVIKGELSSSRAPLRETAIVEEEGNALKWWRLFFQ